MILSVNDFHNHVEVAIQTHGYDTWQGGETIPGERRSIEELEGMSWNLKPPEQTSVRVPSRVAVNERLNRSVSLRFERYPRILKDEPLNKVRRSNKPRRSRRRSEEKWSTLGEPSEKWDYYVRYDAPLNTTPIDEITATGWGEEFLDDEVTPGKVTILNEVEEESDWDDDERSGVKNLVIQEKHAQNQQDFVDEYLPQWDDHLATQKQQSKLEWELLLLIPSFLLCILQNKGLQVLRENQQECYAFLLYVLC
nr:hypothetical protein [Tanacetum cinerariifolium]